jgi:hypothetical protein
LRGCEPLTIVELRLPQRRLISVAEKQRDQQKLWLIVFQIKAIRARLNALAAQYFAFSSLAIIVAAATMIMTAALTLRPLGFLFSAILIALGAFLAVIRIVRIALESSASPLQAAALADERAGLKGRLMTVLLMADSASASKLWPYLVEDTYGRRREFEPSSIEPRWVSRSIFALAAAVLAGLLLLRLTHMRIGGQRLAANEHPRQITADLGNLDIRPADPALVPNAEIYGDAATMQKLADKLAAAKADGSDNGGLSRWLNRARNLAGELQNEITGQPQHRPPVELRLTDKNSSSSPPIADGEHGHKPSNSPDQSGSGKSINGSNSEAAAGQHPGQLAQNGTDFAGRLGAGPTHGSPSDIGSPASGAAGSGSGVSHGSGSDPEHLFGPPSPQPLGSDSFKITIDAQPSDESSSPGAPAYIPPKIKVPLNNRQYSDEPIARASVPAADQMTIKRVFER